MRITVDIDEKQLIEIQEATGMTKKSPAIRQAIDSYVRGLERKRFLRRVLEGKSDYALTNEQVEALAAYDTD